MNDDFHVPDLPAEPTAKERAEYVALRLEQFIREGRKDDEGMSFRKWQAMAKSEIAIAIAEAEMAREDDRLASKRVLFVAAASLTTIGFWGSAVSLNKVGYLAGALVCAAAGLFLLLAAVDAPLRNWRGRRQAGKRRRILKRIESLNRRIKRLEEELDVEAEELEDLLAKARRINRGGKEATRPGTAALRFR